MGKPHATPVARPDRAQPVDGQGLTDGDATDARATHPESMTISLCNKRKLPQDSRRVVQGSSRSIDRRDRTAKAKGARHTFARIFNNPNVRWREAELRKRLCGWCRSCCGLVHRRRRSVGWRLSGRSSDQRAPDFLGIEKGDVAGKHHPGERTYFHHCPDA